MMLRRRGLRLGVMCSRKRKRKRSNNYERGNKSGGRRRVGCLIRLRKCSTEQQAQTTLKIGDRVNLLDLLFTKHTDYLVTYKDRNRPVQAKHLKGKFILLHFVPLVPWSDMMWLYITSLVDIYNALHPKLGFQVVFIGLKFGKYASKPNKLCKSFEEMLSLMPWTAFPVIKSPRYWERKLRFPLSDFIGVYDPCSFVFDPTGVLLSWRPDVHFAKYGAEAFPFTDDKLDFIDSQDEEALKHLSITALLTSPERDYIINNKGQAVPVHTLEDKVVALYFYQEYPGESLAQVLKTAYRLLAHAQNFEIVLVYVHDSLTTCTEASEELFWEHFTDMPWLALPFKDPKCKNLQRIFRIPPDVFGPGPDPRLVIVGPQGKFFEPYGVDILKKFGIPAYPFTRTRCAELAAEFVRNLKLDRFFDPNTSFTQENGPNVNMSQLLGKRIILIVDGLMSTATPNFWQELRARYLQMKGTDAKFEVIHIHTKERPIYGEHVGATTSWLRHPRFHEESRISKLFVHIFRNHVGLLAFDGDGRVLRRTLFPSMERGNMDFPFHSGGLEEVALADLVKRYEWNFWLELD